MKINFAPMCKSVFNVSNRTQNTINTKTHFRSKLSLKLPTTVLLL